MGQSAALRQQSDDITSPNFRKLQPGFQASGHLTQRHSTSTLLRITFSVLRLRSLERNIFSTHTNFCPSSSKMWTSLVKLAFGLAFTAQMASSSTIVSRQEQCDSATNEAAQAACAMKAAFGGSSVVPQLLPDFSPKAALSVKYGDIVIGGAQQMSPSKVATQPFLSLSFISNNPQAFQKACIILGLEYQPQSKGVQLFWLQSSVKIDGTTGLMSSSIQPIVKYRSPNPSSSSGTNEYIFFVFQDPGLENLFRQNPQMGSVLSGAFDFQAFLTITRLSNQLIAGSYFKCSFDGLPVHGQNSSAPATSQVQQVPTSPPATSRKANESTTTNPEQLTQGPPPSAMASQEPVATTAEASSPD
ncbi:hypothetical protein PtB15_8B499 [Puccinia triticina]|nr:hypothetical protein PtB15_8B499 [Puccinia triticina]